MRLLIFLFSLLLISTNVSADRSEQLVSPNGKVRLEIKVSNELSFSVYYVDELILKDCAVNVVVDGKTLGANPKLRSQKRSLMNERIQNVVPLKQATTLDKAQVLTLRFAGQYGVEFRAYDNGYAYRFLLEQKGTVNVQNEGMTLRFPAPLQLIWQRRAASGVLMRAHIRMLAQLTIKAAMRCATCLLCWNRPKVRSC